MKKLLLTIILIYCAFISFAQSGGPDTYGYVWRDSNHPQGPAYNWIDITSLPGATQVTGLADDNTSQSYQIGFQFPYYWYNVTDFIVGSNGYVIFNNGAMSSPFPSIPSPALPNDFVAPFMADLNFAGTGNTAECWFWSNNADSLIISYINVPFWLNSNPAFDGSNTFQVILSKVDSSITFQYKDQVSTSTGTGTFLSIGIENVSGAIGLQHSINTYPATNYAVKFYYPGSNSFIVRDASTIFNNNTETGALFLCQNGNPFSLNSRVGNIGNQTLDTIPVAMEIFNSNGVLQYNMSDTAFNIAPGQTADFNPAPTFAPTVADRYSFRTTTSIANDFTTTNNSKTMKLVVVDTTQTLIPLCYTGNVAVPTADGISWTGGNAGVGVEIIPPFYPCYIHKMEFFISANPQPSSMAGLIFDDDGPNHSAGTLLDSIHLNADSIAVLGWNSLLLLNPIRVDSGSVFVEWMMDGDGIQIGTDSTQPVSNRSYEILGSWSILRYRETRDPMIRLQISSLQVTGTENISADDFAGSFYPSPANNTISIDFKDKSISKNIQFDFYDIRGQRVFSKTLATGKNKYSFDVSGYPSGVYLCKISSGDQQLNRKVIVTK